MPRLAATVESTPHSGIRRMAELARRVPDVVRLDVGDPSFNTAQHINEAAFAAMLDGYTKYTASGGFQTLRELLATKVESRNGFSPTPDDIVVTAGGCGGLFTSLLTILDPGDEILVPDPGWPNYRAMVHVLGGTSVGYPVDLVDGTVNMGEVEPLVSPRTRVIIVNSPNNPTGAVYPPDVLEAIAGLARRHDLWIISDECYDEIVFDRTHASISAVAPSDRVITVFSFSKTYAMTGWRLGYVVAPTNFAGELLKAQEPVHANASSISQKAAEAALSGSQDQVVTMRDAYRGRRTIAEDLLRAAGVNYLKPHGAFYMMVDVSRLGSSMEAARSLLESSQVAVVPGAAFGPRGEGWVRISLCATEATLHEGLSRVVQTLAQVPEAIGGN